MSDELKKLYDEVHNEVTTFNFDGKEVPCIILNEKRYDEIMSKIAGKPLSINTDLNILQNGLGNVFVEIFLTFSQGKISEKFLINANKDLFFFQSLAKNSLLALSSPHSHYGKDNIFMIQLPRPEKAEEALEIITNGLRKDNQE